MGLLAYDPTRLAFLRTVMIATVDELRSVRCTDPAAGDALRRVRSTTVDLTDIWLPLVDRILNSPAMTPGARLDAGVDELRQSLTFVMAAAYGWSVQPDPLDDDQRSVTVEEARALGARLDSCDWAALADDASGLVWLAEQLAIIGRDPNLSREFLANFHEWASLCDRLGFRRALLLADVPIRTQVTVAQLDAVFAGLAAAQRHTLPFATTCLTAAAVLPQIDVMSPYSAALVVRHLRLDGLLLAEVTDRLLGRWVTMTRALTVDGRRATDIDLGGPNAADLLLPLLLTDPAACVHYVALAARHPDTLFTTAAEPELVHRVVLIGTDPRHLPSAHAGEVIVTLLDYFARDQYPCNAMCDGYDGTWPTFLADLVTPWLLQLSPLNDEWHADAVRRRDLLAFVLADDDALQRLIDTSAAATSAIATSLVDRDGHTLEEFAAFVGMLAELVVDERVGDEERRRAAWDMMWTVVQVGTNFAPGGPLGGIAAGFAVDLVESGAGTAFDAPDPANVAARAGYAAEWTLTVAAATMTGAMVQRWREQGAVGPADVTAPPTPDAETDHPSLRYVEQFLDWRAGLPGGPTGVLAGEITAVAFAFVGPSVTGRHFAG